MPNKLFKNFGIKKNLTRLLLIAIANI